MFYPRHAHDDRGRIESNRSRGCPVYVQRFALGQRRPRVYTEIYHMLGAPASACLCVCTLVAAGCYLSHSARPARLKFDLFRTQPASGHSDSVRCGCVCVASNVSVWVFFVCVCLLPHRLHTNRRNNRLLFEFVYFVTNTNRNAVDALVQRIFELPNVPAPSSIRQSYIKQKQPTKNDSAVLSTFEMNAFCIVCVCV